MRLILFVEQMVGWAVYRSMAWSNAGIVVMHGAFGRSEINSLLKETIAEERRATDARQHHTGLLRPFDL
jgi:hypothetical protein